MGFVRLLPLVVAAACVHPTVDVSIMGANIGASRADLAAWDGVGKVSPDARAAAAALMAQAGPLGAVGANALGDVLDAVAPPDPFGRMQLFGAAGPIGEPVVLPMVADTYTARWPLPSPTLRGVVLDPDVKVRVQVADMDTILDPADDIATVDLGVRELRRALAAGAPIAIDYAAPTGGQLLTLTIAASRTPR
jgi:hypothetical protein